MTKGTVKWVDASKAFGTMQPEANEKDVFFHWATMEATRLAPLADGQDIISYTVTDGDGRLIVANMALA